MNEDWYEKPKQELKPFPKWLNLVWAAIVSGIGTGLLIAIGIIIQSYIFPKPDVFNLSTTQEIQVILFVIMLGATSGFIFGAPIALIFGPLTIYLTRNINPKFQYFLRIFIGAICGIIAFYFLNLFSKATQLFSFNSTDIYIPTLSGVIGAIIFLFINKSK